MGKGEVRNDSWVMVNLGSFCEHGIQVSLINYHSTQILALGVEMCHHGQQENTGQRDPISEVTKNILKLFNIIIMWYQNLETWQCGGWGFCNHNGKKRAIISVYAQLFPGFGLARIGFSSNKTNCQNNSLGSLPVLLQEWVMSSFFRASVLFLQQEETSVSFHGTCNFYSWLNYPVLWFFSSASCNVAPDQ